MNVDVQGNTVLFVVDSDITTVTVPDIRDKVLESLGEGVNEVKLDLNSVEMVDSTGISLLISIQNTLKKKSGSLTLLNTSDDISHMFKLMRLDKFFSVQPR